MRIILLGFLLVIINFHFDSSWGQDSLDQNSFENLDSNVEPQDSPIDGEPTVEGDSIQKENIDPNAPQDSLGNPVNVDLNGEAVAPTNQPQGFDSPSLQEQDSSGSQTTLDTLNPGTTGTGEEFFPAFIYDDRGRKDPFAPVIKDVPIESSKPSDSESVQDEKSREGLSKFEIAALTVTAILVGKNKPKALVKDPTGTVYVIQENDIVGRNNGVVRRIRNGQIVIVESREQKDGERLYTTQVLSLRK